MKTIMNWILDHPKQTLILMFVATLGVATQLVRIVQDTSTEAFLPRGHSSYQDKKLVDHLYGINDPILISVIDKENPDIFNKEALSLLKKMSHFVENLEGVNPSSVRSLATREDIQGTYDGFDVTDFLKEIPTTEEGFRKLRERVMAFPLYVGLIVSQDGNAGGIIADVQADADVIKLFHEVHNFIKDEVDTDRFQVNLTGPPIVTGTLNVYLNRDAMVLNPISAVVTCVLLFLLFRSLRGILLPFAVVMPSVVWALGSMGLMRFPFTPFSNAVPVVILATGLADSIHLIGHYYEVQIQNPHFKKKQVLFDVVTHLWKPIVITSLTTAAGFTSLVLTSPMIPVQEFGITVAIGVLGAMFFSLFALPPIMMLLPLKVPRFLLKRVEFYRHNPNQTTGFLEKLMGRLFYFVTTRPYWAISLMVLLCGIGVAGTMNLRVDYNPIVFFPTDSAVFKDNKEISASFVGTNFIELHLDSGKEEGVFETDFLNKIERLQNDIEGWKQVGGTLSLVDYLKKMNQAINEDGPEYYRLAEHADANAQYFFLYSVSGDPSQFEEIVDNAHRHLNLRIFLKEGTDSVNRPFINWLLQRIKQDFAEGEYVIGGEAHVNYHWMRLIEESVIYSVLLMSGSIFLIGWVLQGSFLSALLLILPVNMGVLLTYAVMGFLDIPIGLGTSIFASIAIGIGIDYAIHYIAHYSRVFKEKRDYIRATHETLTKTGKLLVGNSATVIGGFLVLIFAKTTPPNQIGIFVAVGVGTSLLMTLLVLSVLTRYIKSPAKTPIKTKKNVWRQA
jgi:uncharacterized protein